MKKNPKIFLENFLKRGSRKFAKFFLEKFLKRWMANRPPCLGMAEGGRWMRGYGASPHGGGTT